METPEQWKRIKGIVAEALEREPSVREAFVKEACAQDTELREEVESLLVAYEEAGPLSKHPQANVTESPLPASIGPYTLIRELGHGGMGQVWLAEQTEPVRRRVALKLIKGGIYDAAIVQRFHSERQSLALMDHPAISKVFEAGATPTGQPYLVMEYVDGLPITDYCDKKKLEIPDRLKLFLQVCDGVQHAHQKAIIHRDLKPSNILVAEVDGKPTPRIIDFGLAKASAPVDGETMFTREGSFLGTPGYMSPEQADPGMRDIDTRADVYSLGVILYELLTGCLPIDGAQWKNQRFEDVLRQLRETEAPRPSTKVTASRDTLTARAESRNCEPKQLSKLLRGDLDWITLKALEKDRERRYGTPSELGADLDCYLENRPVMARPASRAYRLRKYLRRNRLPAAVTAAVFALLLAFVVTEQVELRRITRERDRADRITEFMTNMFQVSDPSEARGNGITAREILDKASDDIKTGLAKDPEAQAQMMEVMGEVYESLGLYSRAQVLLTQAVETRRRVFGVSRPDTLKSMRYLAWVLYDQGRYGEAEKLQQEALEVYRRTLGLENAATLAVMSDLAACFSAQFRYADAEKLQRETLDIQRRVLGEQGEDTLNSMNNLANTLSNERRYADAEKLRRKTLDIQRRVFGPEYPATLRSMVNLADTLFNETRYAEAEKLEREVLDVQRRVLGPEHPETLMSMYNLAYLLNKTDRSSEAEPLARTTLEIRRRILGPEHKATLKAMVTLATSLLQQRHDQEAEELLEAAISAQKRTLKPDHPDTAASLYKMAIVKEHKGKIDDALALLREAVDHGLSPEDRIGMETDSNLAGLHRDSRFTSLVEDARNLATSMPPPIH